MSMFEVLGRFGTAALLRFTAALVVFVLLHLVRIPLVLAARVLEVSLRRVNAYAARQASSPPQGPINHFYSHVPGEEARNVGV